MSSLHDARGEARERIHPKGRHDGCRCQNALHRMQPHMGCAEIDARRSADLTLSLTLQQDADASTLWWMGPEDRTAPKCPRCDTPLELYETDWSRATVAVCLKCWLAIKDP